MSFFLAFEKVSILFLLIVVGYIAGKAKLVSQEGQKELSNLVVNVTMPATIIMGMQMTYDKQKFSSALKIMFILFVAYFLMFIISKFLASFYPLDSARKDLVELAAVMPNTGFMGYPMTVAILGQDALFYTVLGSGVSFEVMAWTYAYNMMGRHLDKDGDRNILKEIIVNPGIISILIGFSLFITSTKIPQPFGSTMELLAAATSPMAMILIGISLSSSPIKEIMTSTKLYLIALTKLLVFPLMTFFTLKFFNISGIELQVPVLMVSMPTAAYVAIFASNRGNDANMACRIVFMSSLLSVITIPIMAMLIG